MDRCETELCSILYGEKRGKKRKDKGVNQLSKYVTQV